MSRPASTIPKEIPPRPVDNNDLKELGIIVNET
jgi:hypothetical protein